MPPSITSTNTTSTTVNISWLPAAGAIQYSYRYRIVGIATWSSVVISNGTSTGVTITGLVPSTTYEFQIRTKCNDNPIEWSPFSSLNNFTTAVLRTEESDVNDFNAILYPNPADKNISLEIKSNNEAQAQITITDMLGRQVLNEIEFLIIGNNIINYNIENFAAGMYLVQIQNGSESRLIKLVK